MKNIESTGKNKQSYLISSKLFFYLLILGLVAGSFYLIRKMYYTESGFMAFRNKKYYAPNSKNGEGLIGITDKMLEDALRDVSDIRPTNISQLNNFYKRLKFYIPVYDGSYYNLDDIRLIDYKPANRKDSLFYFNSSFYNAIESQKNNLSKKYFTIHIINKKEQNGNNYRLINKINIDSMLFKTDLATESWEGTIRGNFDMLFDTLNSYFLIYGNTILPVCNNAQNASEKDPFIINVDVNSCTFKNAQGRDLNVFANSEQYFNKTYIGPNRKALQFTFLERDNQGGVERFFTFHCDHNIIHLKLHRVNYDTIDYKKADLTVIPGYDIPFRRDTVISIYSPETHKLLSKFKLIRYNPFKNLSYTVYTNKGLQRFCVDTSFTDLFTQQVLSFLPGIVEKNSGNIDLTLNPLLSKYLEHKMVLYMNSLKNHKTVWKGSRGEHFEMSVCLMNAATGEVIAAPYATTVRMSEEAKHEQRNFNFTRHFIGSTFKPLLTMACLGRYPELYDYRMQGGTANTQKLANMGNHSCVRVLGCPMRPGFATKGKTNQFVTMDQRNFFATSNDVYPVALSMIATLDNLEGIARNCQNVTPYLNRNASPYYISFKENTMICQNGYINLAFTKIFDKLYGFTYLPESKVTGSILSNYDLLLWKNNDLFSLERCKYLSPDKTDMHFDLFGNPENLPYDLSRENFRAEFVTWVLGQGLNEWNNVKLCEAYSRFFTRKKVDATFIRQQAAAPQGNDLSHEIAGILANLNHRTSTLINIENNIEQSWSHMITNLMDAQRQGSWLKIAQVSMDVVNRDSSIQELANHHPMHIVGKTGTPNLDTSKYERSVIQFLDKTIYQDRGMFAFYITSHHVCEILQHRVNNQTPLPARCGLVGFIYINHVTYEDPKNDGIWSSDAVKFLSPDVLKQIIIYTKSLY